MTAIKIITNEHEEVMGVELNGELVMDESDARYPFYWVELLKKIPNVTVLKVTEL